MANETSFKKLSDIISVSNNDKSLLLVNNQWTFEVPAGLIYEVDGEIEPEIKGAISLTSSQKPLALRGIKSGNAYKLNFALEEHFDFFGNYTSVVDCRYDNRVAEEEIKQHIIIDGDDFYVDMVMGADFIGVSLDVRVRGENIDPFDFTVLLVGAEDNTVEKAVGYFKEIAHSIKPKTKTKSSKTTKKAQTISDPNCIINGTVLQKYIGSDKNIVLPSGITEIASNIFSGRASLESLTVPEGVSIIGSRACENCFDLNSVVLPDSLEELGGYAFCDCHSLRNITLGNNLKCISNSTFSECYELNDVIIPETVREIEQFAFKNCRKFKKIIIPGKVKGIGFTAFSNCINLEFLYIPASVKRIDDNFMDETPFSGCDKLTIHCPAGSYAEEYCKSHGINYEIDNAKYGSDSVSTKRTTPVDSSGTTALVDDAWEITVPDGYVYSTDKSVIGNHRNLVIVQDKKKNRLDNPFEATESFTSMVHEVEDAVENAYLVADMLFNGDQPVTIVNDDADLLVEYAFSRTEHNPDNPNETLDIFYMLVCADRYISSIQIFFNNSKKSRKTQQALVDKVARSIRLKGADANTNYDYETLAEAQRAADEISNSLNETMSEIGDQLKEMGKSLEAAKEVMAKAEESREAKNQSDEEMRQKVFDALGDEAKELVMFSALYSDKQMNNPNSKQNDFYDCYQDEFGKITKKDLFALRKDVMQKMKNASYTDKQKGKIRGFDFEIRYHLMALMLFNASMIDDPEESKAFAMVKAAEWFSDEEINRVEELLNIEINEVRKTIGDQLSSFDPDWANFDTAKKHLTAKIAYPSDYKDDDNPEFFAIEKDWKYSLRVKLTSNGMFGAGIINLMPWYWNTTIEEVWESALKKVEYAEDCIFPKKEQKDFVAEALGLVNRKISENPTKSAMLAALKQKELENSDIASSDSDWEINEYKNGTVGIKKYAGSKEKVLIPTEIGGKTVSKILDATFRDDSSSIKELVVPSIFAEGDCSFLYDMSGIERVIFLEGVTKLPKIWSCDDLKSIELPDSLTDISFTISHCPKLYKINIPKNVSRIVYSFGSCNSLKEIIVSPENTNFSSDNGSLYNKNKTELIRAASVESFEFSKTTKEIGNYAFDGCDKLLEIIVPSSVKKIGDNAFCDCTALKKAVILGCNSKLSPEAFRRCEKLEDVSLPDCVTSIGSKAFEGCSSLKKVTLSPKIKTIAKDAFEGCSSMEGITLPRSFEAKAAGLFKQSPNIKITYIDLEPNEQTAKKTPETTAKPKTVKEVSDTKDKPVVQEQPKVAPSEQKNTVEEPKKKKGKCYVATCAYGSYDCPEVWTLRRFRDYVLAKTWYGRLFITLYYFFAPMLIKCFGESEWFKGIWRYFLDKKVDKLNNKGFENTPYDDV